MIGQHVWSGGGVRYLMFSAVNPALCLNGISIPATDLLVPSGILFAMEMETKADFDKTMARFEAWWNFEVIDRPPVSLWVPSGKKVQWPQKQHASERERWFDMDYRFDQHEAAVQSGKWIGDNIPSFHGNLGPEILATLYGAELEFTRDSSWSRPMCRSSREVLNLQPDLDTPYWKWEREWVRRSLEQGKGKWITCITDLHTHADLLAALREPQELLLELMDDYEGVKQAIAHLTPLFDLVYDDQANAILAAGQPTMSWLPAPHLGRSCVLQADFICMISPDMFRDVFLPPLEYEMSRLDRSIFHLDGAAALKHLDALLECKKLNAIQWVWGDGNGPAAKWIDTYKRIQAAGKSMQIVCVDMDDAIKVAEHLKPEGCFFAVGGNYSEDQANAFLQRMERWTATGKL